MNRFQTRTIQTAVALVMYRAQWRTHGVEKHMPEAFMSDKDAVSACLQLANQKRTRSIRGHSTQLVIRSSHAEVNLRRNVVDSS
jgi:hypothetical protein